jgi:hypothetical protein
MPDNAAALNVIAEALARVEYKLDMLLWALNATKNTTMAAPNLGANMTRCPLCFDLIQYQVDIINQVTKRVCGCKTGMQPPTISFLPAVPEVKHGNSDGSGRGDGPEAEAPANGRRGQGR